MMDNVSSGKVLKIKSFSNSLDFLQTCNFPWLKSIVLFLYSTSTNFLRWTVCSTNLSQPLENNRESTYVLHKKQLEMMKYKPK